MVWCAALGFEPRILQRYTRLNNRHAQDLVTERPAGNKRGQMPDPAHARPAGSSWHGRCVPRIEPRHGRVSTFVLRWQLDYAAIARQFFSDAEVGRLSTLPDHRYVEAFLACWTKKEAYVKARGRGLAMPLKSFTVPLTADPGQGPGTLHVASSDVDRATRWSVHTLRPAPGYIGALAIEGCGWRLSQWQWPG